MTRKPLSKKVRFDTFKRDNFTCQYCGNQPPAIVLEVDHIQPVSKGGANTVDNLLTSCFECNRGKGAVTLEMVPKTVQEKRERFEEAEEQIKAFNRVLAARRRRENKEIDAVEKVYQEEFPTWTFSKSTRNSVRVFLERLPLDDVLISMDQATGKINHYDRALKYFFGVCWGKIKQGGL